MISAAEHRTMPVSELIHAAPLWGVAANDFWYALPLLVSSSLVYAGTRYEAKEDIVRGALRFGVWVAAFMLVVFAVLYAIITFWQ